MSMVSFYQWLEWVDLWWYFIIHITKIPTTDYFISRVKNVLFYLPEWKVYRNSNPAQIIFYLPYGQIYPPLAGVNFGPCLCIFYDYSSHKLTSTFFPLKNSIYILFFTLLALFTNKWCHRMDVTWNKHNHPKTNNPHILYLFLSLF